MIGMAFTNIYFSLGSNLGDREKIISEALRLMDEAFGRHYVALSKLIETEPAGFSGGKFLNAAVLYRLPGNLNIAESVAQGGVEGALWILDTVKSIERALGRTDPPEYDSEGRRIYHSRTIDIDILFYGKERIDHPRLVIPHKGIAGRPFVMIPLREIARPALKRAFPEYFEEKEDGYE